MTSSSVIHAASISKEINSLRWRYVSWFSARNAGPISNTRSIPPKIASCLYNCGLCERNAGVSKYIIGKRLVPPSDAEAMIFGVLISLNPSVMRCSRPYCKTRALSVNMALTCALRRSRNRLSKRVSRPMDTVSVMPSGRGTFARVRTFTPVATISYAGGGGVSPSLSLGGRF